MRRLLASLGILLALAGCGRAGRPVRRPPPPPPAAAEAAVEDAEEDAEEKNP